MLLYFANTLFCNGFLFRLLLFAGNECIIDKINPRRGQKDCLTGKPRFYIVVGTFFVGLKMLK